MKQIFGLAKAWSIPKSLFTTRSRLKNNLLPNRESHQGSPRLNRLPRLNQASIRSLETHECMTKSNINPQNPLLA